MKRIFLLIAVITFCAFAAAGSTHRVYTNTGAAAIAGSFKAFSSVIVKQITVHFSAAPVASENFVITLDAYAGAAYDTVIYTVDPSASSITDLVWIPDDGAFAMVYGDELDITFANTNTNTIGISVYYELGQ
jgi:hypothetical protein